MISEDQRIAIIENYINSYNNFDIEGMINDLADTIVFKNISNNEITLSTDGINAFKVQAEKAKAFFSSRKQTIIKTVTSTHKIEVIIDYTGVLNIDLPNGMRKGETLNLKGVSVFTFLDDKIIEINDIS